MTVNGANIRCTVVSCPLCGEDACDPVARGKDYEYTTSDQTFTFVRCRNCGHEYLNPRPVSDDLNKAYPAHYYTLEGRHTSRQSTLISRMKSLVIKRRLRYFDELFKEDATVLEVGCGDGSLLLDLKRRFPHLRLTGMDFSVSYEIRTQLAENNIGLMACRIEDAVLKAETFDLIIMNQLIEHVIDPAGVIEKLAQSLKFGGYLSIETPNRCGYDRRFFKDSFWGGYYFPRHLHLFDKKNMEGLLGRFGLRLERHGNLLAPIIWAFSFHGFFMNCPGRFGFVLGAFFSDRNPVCLGVFTLVDLLARVVGMGTSNQKFVAMKEDTEKQYTDTQTNTD